MRLLASRLLPRIACAASVLVAAHGAMAVAGSARPLPAAGAGISLRLEQADRFLDSGWLGPEAPASGGPFLRLVVPWSRVGAGRPGLGELDRLVGAAAGADLPVLLCLSFGERQRPAPGDADGLAAWLGFVRAIAERFSDRVDLFQIDEAPDGAAGLPARDYAFLFRRAAVTIRAVAPAARIVLADLDPAATAYLAALYDHEVAPYADAVALRGAPRAVGDEALAALRRVVLEHDPASPLWFVAVPRSAEPGAVAREFLAAAGRGAGLTLFRLQSEDGPAGEGPGRVLAVLLRSFTDRVALMPETGAAGARFLGGSGQELQVQVHRFLDEASFRVLVLYAPGEGAPSGEVRLLLDTADVSDPRLVDLETGAERDAGIYIPDRRSGTTKLDVVLDGAPGLVTYRRFASQAAGLAPESVEVAGADERTVEEILARHQSFQEAQDDRLHRYLADAQLDLHFALGAGRSLDVTFLQGFFYERGRGPEWERRELLVNGVRWRAKRIPEFPLIQPDKVVILPLEVHLDRRYRYRLVGEDTVDGFRTWEVAFEPADPEALLYRGRVWIDQATYARVKMSVRQRGTAPPFVSNDEVDHYRPLRGPDGRDTWVLSHITGAQLYTTSGRSFTVNREVRFSNFRINPEDFDERRAEAYASDHQILRDTEQGYRYLKKSPDGERVVQEGISADQLFVLGGVFHDESVEFPIPFAGINYFNLGIGGTDRQMNVFFGGAVLFANYTDPSLFGTRLEGTVDVFGLGFDATDRFIVDGEEIDERNVDRKMQNVRGHLGLNLGNFWKLRGSYALEWDLFSRDEDTEDFVVPVDTFVHTVGLDVNFNRRAWSLHAGGEIARRRDWEPWGTAGDLAAFDPDTRQFARWGASVAREVYLPRFQKLRFQGEWVDGRDLDRFSRYQFGFFSDTRLRGFSGSGIRFDQGAVLRAQYSFNFFDAVRFDVSLDHGRVREEGAASGTGDHTGAGLSGNFMGPWGTILRFDWGLALDSEIPGVEGQQEVQLIVLKLF